MQAIMGRRQFLAGASAGFFFVPISQALADIDEESTRTLAFDNIHTGEKLEAEYWANGNYLPDALDRINYLLRDFRTDEVHAIEPKLLDLLSILHTRLDTYQPFEVISGYRSPKTNAMLHAERRGVAAKSLHMKGQAIDIRIAGRTLRSLHKTALNLRAGGVGYYPADDFVHVDTGPIRSW